MIFRLLIALALVGGLSFLVIEERLSAERPLSRGQAHYYEGCGGCHGLNGVSARAQIPVLRDAVGTFMCTQAGRDYLIRLPNVAFANMDNATLAKTMNYVVFNLGRGSVRKNVKPYTDAEVGRLRKQPLKNTDLATMREALLADAIKACHPGSSPAQSAG